MRFQQSWMGRNCSRESEIYFPASVPGNIQYDYGVAHGFGDPQYNDNCEKYRELENDHWEYKACLQYEKKEGERVFFVSGGIDYRYDVAINGKTVYSYEGMYRPVDIDLTDEVTGEGDILTVHIYPHPKRAGAPEGTRDEADHSCKPPVCYGWDWNPRLLISGMWQEAYIETRDAFYIDAEQVRASLSEDFSHGTVKFVYLCEKPCQVALFDKEGKELYRGSEYEITLENPNLWWCNGEGDPYLYRWEISNEKETRSGTLGFRRVRLLRNVGAKGPREFPKSRYEAPITIELNGRRIFAKGSNWVNPELFWGQITKERYDELLTLAKDCHMNILRMWGGAGAAKKDFYDLCDRYGIMVWQEFMLACNDYPDDEEYLSVLKMEANSLIHQLRSHPCLAIWCGGNELFNSWSGMDEQSLPLRLLNLFCYQFDRDTPFLYTSPLYGMGHGGYRFYAEQQGGEIFAQFQRAHNTAYTEFGCPAIADMEILKKILPPEDLTSLAPTTAWRLHHGFGAWGAEDWVCLDVLERYFGKQENTEEAVKNSQWLQYAGYQSAFEEARRQWPYCSMAINWCFNEPWMTAAGNNLLAYPSIPRPGYYAVQSALRTALFSARIPKFSWRAGETFEAELWLLNDGNAPLEGVVSAVLRVGEVCVDLLEWRASAEVRSNTQGPTLRCILPNVDADRMTLHLQSANGLESSYCLQYRPLANVKIGGSKTMNI